MKLLAYATRHRPRQPTARYHLAAALHALGKHKAALAQLDAAFSFATDFAEARQASALLADVRRQLSLPAESP